MVRYRFVFAALAIMILATAGALVLSSRLGTAPDLHGTLLDPPLPAADFALETAGGERLGPQAFRGQLVVLFFGFTNCPDICPMTMHRLSEAMAELGDRADQVQVILVSVDPERDPPEVIDGYAKRFDPRFLGLTGSDEELRVVTSSYGIFYARNEVEGETGYTVDHSASTLVLDRNGNLRLVWPFDTSAEAMAHDLQHLIRR
jgi:protein SCO1